MSRESFQLISTISRQRGGIGFYADDRNNDRLEEMGCTASTTKTEPFRLRRGSKAYGDGQRLDIFQVTGVCSCCQRDGKVLNIVHICGDCAAAELTGTKAKDDLDAEIRAMQAEARASLKARR